MKLIAGIDPGTTVGWALLDLQGRVVSVGSQKELDLDSLIALFTKQGRVIVVGSDKAKIPYFVQDSSTKLGAKVVGPLQDMRVDEKRALTRDFSFSNSHEMDALSGALTAFRKVQPLLNKIKVLLEKERKLGLFEDVVELVLKEGISIRAAVALLSPVEELKEEKSEVQKRDEDIVKLYDALSRARKDNVVLLNKNREFENRLFSVERQLSFLKARSAGLVKPKTPAEIARNKDGVIMSLAQRLKNSLQSRNELSRLVDRLEKQLLLQDKVALLRLPRLGWDELMKNKEFIMENSVLFVDDANEISEKAVEWLHKKGVQLLICAKLPGNRARAYLPFACVPAEDCEVLSRIVLVNQSWLDKVRADRDVLSKVVEAYKNERLPGGS